MATANTQCAVMNHSSPTACHGRRDLCESYAGILQLRGPPVRDTLSIAVPVVSPTTALTVYIQHKSPAWRIADLAKQHTTVPKSARRIVQGRPTLPPRPSVVSGFSGAMLFRGLMCRPACALDRGRRDRGDHAYVSGMFGLLRFLHVQCAGVGSWDRSVDIGI